MNYYNTTHLEGNDLRSAVQRAKGLDSAILTYYVNKREAFSPWQILHKMESVGLRYPITSVRRSINTLTKQGHLLKTSEKVIGDFKEPEHKWAINPIRYPSIRSEQKELFNNNAA